MWRWLRRPGIIVGIVLLVGAGYWFLRPRTPKPIGIAYAGERNVTLWNTLAPVRQTVTDVHYGERLELLRQEGPAMQVRAASGITGWVLDSRQMMDANLWQHSADLLNRAHSMPVQALGHTNAISNVHIEPGRNTQRTFQFPRGTAVAVLGRAAVAESEDASPQNSPAEKAKLEDWLLVMRVLGAAGSYTEAGAASSGQQASTPGSVGEGPDAQLPPPGDSAAAATPIAGWVLARFIEPDLPDTVKDHASAAGIRPVAWFELNRVSDGSGGEAPQYLVAGTRGNGDQACDFNALQVYTWGTQNMRYETAYIESELCGKLPIQVSRTARGPEFHFENAGDDPGQRAYVMEQTRVQRIREGIPGNPQKRTTALEKHRHSPS